MQQNTFKKISYSKGNAHHKRNQRPPSPVEMLPMIKMSQNVTILFLPFQFLSASSRTTVTNNNIDSGGPGPLNLIFANQF